MSKEKVEVVQRGGVSFLGLLPLLFIALKLLAVEPVATWSWWWVTAPLWAPAALVIAILLLIILPIAIAAKR